MENKINQIVDTLADIRVTLAKQAVTLERNTDDLAEHMQQTALLKSRQDAFERTLQDVAFPARALKWVGGLIIALSTLIAAVVGLIKIFGV